MSQRDAVEVWTAPVGGTAHATCNPRIDQAFVRNSNLNNATHSRPTASMHSSTIIGRSPGRRHPSLGKQFDSPGSPDNAFSPSLCCASPV